MSTYVLGLYEKSMPEELSVPEKLSEAKAAGYDFLELSIDETDRKLARLSWDREERAELVRAMFRENQDLAESVVNWYSRYVNLFLFETIHQEFNPSRVKLCNLLYLLTVRRPLGPERSLAMTQEDLADTLGMSRVQITRELSDLRRRGILSTARGRLTITDLPALEALCTAETV